MNRIIEEIKKRYESYIGGDSPIVALERAIKEIDDEFVFDVYKPTSGAPARARIYMDKWAAICDAYPDELHCYLYKYEYD